MGIVFKNGDIKVYDVTEYTDYKYLGDVFVVIKKNQWIGIYSMSEIKSIEIEPEV